MILECLAKGVGAYIGMLLWNQIFNDILQVDVNSAQNPWAVFIMMSFLCIFMAVGICLVEIIIEKINKAKKH